MGLVGSLAACVEIQTWSINMVDGIGVMRVLCHKANNMSFPPTVSLALSLILAPHSHITHWVHSRNSAHIKIQKCLDYFLCS